MLPNFEHTPPQGQSLSIEERDFERHDREDFTSQLIVEVEHSSSKQLGIADDLHIDESLISKWKDARPGQAQMPAWRLIRWTKKVGPGLLRYIARKCGYDLVPRGSAPAPVHLPHVEELLGALSRHTGDAVGKTFEDIASKGEWTLGEKANNLGLWLRIQHLVNGIVELLQRETVAGRRA